MKQTSIFKLFIAAGVAVWAIPYVFTALSNALVPLIVAGALPDTHYTFNPYTMLIAAGIVTIGTLGLILTWTASANRHDKKAYEARANTGRANVKVSNVKIASSAQAENQPKRQLSQQQA